jgi:hypothetical protein
MMKELNPVITCQDGFTMSVQGSEYNYSTPREDNPPNGYTHVECGFPSSTPVTSALLDYAECGGNTEYTKAVYPYTPVEVVRAELDAHGGIATGCLPS